MTRKVIFGIAAVLAVVVVAAVVAVLVSGTNQTDTINAEAVAAENTTTTTPLPGSAGPSENTGPGGLTAGHRWTAGPTTTTTTTTTTTGPPREVFMQTNNGCK